jgi:alpha-ketoglutarate-dependent taurine dioxygenase
MPAEITPPAEKRPAERDILRVRRLGAHIGAEVYGVDVAAAPGHAALLARIRAALLEHSVLVLRGQREISNAQHAAFAACLGEV